MSKPGVCRPGSLPREESLLVCSGVRWRPAGPLAHGLAHGCVTLVSGPLLTWPSPPHTYTPVSSPVLPRTPVIRAHPTPRWPHRNQLRLRRPISKSGHFGKFWPDVHLLGRGRCSIRCSSLPFMPKKVLAGKAENVRLFQEKGKMVKRHFQFWKPMPCALKTDDDDALIWPPPVPAEARRR